MHFLRWASQILNDPYSDQTPDQGWAHDNAQAHDSSHSHGHQQFNSADYDEYHGYQPHFSEHFRYRENRFQKCNSKCLYLCIYVNKVAVC